MLNANKIRWMTRASIYEKEEGREDLARNTFFASDYVRFCLLRNFICVTLAAIMILMIYLLCRVEYVMTLAAEMNLGPFVRQVLTIYLVTVVVYTLIGAVIYSVQYVRSKERVRKYYRMLKLIEKYGKEDSK